MTRYHESPGWFGLLVVVVLALSLLVWSANQETQFKVYDEDRFIVCTVYIEDNAIAQRCERQS